MWHTSYLFWRQLWGQRWRVWMSYSGTRKTLHDMSLDIFIFFLCLYNVVCSASMQKQVEETLMSKCPPARASEELTLMFIKTNGHLWAVYETLESSGMSCLKFLMILLKLKLRAFHNITIKLSMTISKAVTQACIQFFFHSLTHQFMCSFWEVRECLSERGDSALELYPHTDKGVRWFVACLA